MKENDFEVINKYNGLTGTEYAQATLHEKTKCVWFLGNKILKEGQSVTPKQMLCIRTWLVVRVVRYNNKDHIYLIQN